ncbi:hypothetical protein ASF47_03695 [Nocardioides sp. Leaf285]|nr:hypothetical protein ASF47_03695 [Nocardioides sp. Leaf285]
MTCADAAGTSRSAGATTGNRWADTRNSVTSPDVHASPHQTGVREPDPMVHNLAPTRTDRQDEGSD